MNESPWKEFFTNWPKDVPTRGVLMMAEDQIPFQSFMTSDNLLLVERTTPDTVGARKVVVRFEEVTGVKLTEVVESKSMAAVGFKETMIKQKGK